MKLKLLSIIALFTALFSGIVSNAQTTGTLTFTFTPVQHTTGNYSGTKHALAVWIQSGSTSTGSFIKSKLRRAGVVTKDHLKVYSVKAGGTQNDCLTNTNVTDASTGATLSSYSAHTITWDGKNVNGSANGTLVADGTYSVAVEFTWGHGSSTATRYFTFTKGPNADVQTPASDANFSNISLNWAPTSTVGINEANTSAEQITIYPNPNTTGVFNVTYSKANTIKVYNTLGDLIISEKVQNSTSNATIDMTEFQNGVYFFVISDDEKSITRKVILNK